VSDDRPPRLDRLWLRCIVGALFVIAAAILLFARTVDRDLNHDEHQFLAPAALLSRQGLQPWRDYPLFHLPNLVFIYAAADRLTGDLILGAKLVCFSASALALIGLTVAALRTRTFPFGLALAAISLLLLVGDPLFRYTAGKTWNHEVPTALLLGALASMAAASWRQSLLFIILSGVLAGLATGCRLTFAPAMIGLFIFVWLQPIPVRQRGIQALALTIAGTAALAPSLYYLFFHRDAFIFGNFEFPRLRLLDPNDTRAHETIVWWRKLRFFLKEIVRESWPLFLLWGAIGIRPGWRWLRRNEGGDVVAAVVLVMLPFILLGCFAPARYQYQHYFVFIPLLVYGFIAGMRNLHGSKQLAWTAIAAVLAIVVSLRATNDYSAIRTLANREEWFSSKANALGKRLRSSVPDSARVLTLAPVIPLAGNLSIYPEFATGVFAWRGAHHVPLEQRRKLHLIAPEDLRSVLTSPPAAILTGVEEPEEEQPLVEWAEKHGYRQIHLKKKRTLWVPPGHHPS
jgi:hypothetical protein